MVTVMLGIGSANLGKLASVLVLYGMLYGKSSVQMRMAKIRWRKRQFGIVNI